MGFVVDPKSPNTLLYAHTLPSLIGYRQLYQKQCCLHNFKFFPDQCMKAKTQTGKFHTTHHNRAQLSAI